MNFFAMDMSEAQAWVMIIGVAGGIIIQIVTIIMQGRNKAEVKGVLEVQDQKLNVIHNIANDRFSNAEKKAEVAIARVAQLEEKIRASSGEVPAVTKQTGQSAVEKKEPIPAYPKEP